MSLKSIVLERNMRIDIKINRKAINEIKRLVKYRLFKLKTDMPNRRLNYSAFYIEYEEDVLKKLLEMLDNLELTREVIL